MSRRSLGGGGGSRSSFSSSGGSRSSFSSRSSSSSSRSSFSSSSSYNSGRSHGSSVHWHGHYHYGGGASVHVSGKVVLSIILVAFIGIFAFVIAGLSAIVSSHNQMLEVKKSDYNYYISMIEYAERNKDYQVDCKVTKVAYDDEVGGYYFEYAVPYEYTYEIPSRQPYGPSTTETKQSTLTHATFACYKLEDIKPLLGTKIPVALSCPKSVVDKSTDSMPMNYANTKVSDDAEYQITLASRSKFVRIRVVFIIVEVLTVVGLVFTIVFNRKKTDNNSNDAELETPTDEELPSVPQNMVCMYCGNTLPAGTKKCPNCGANLKIKY